MKDKVTRKQVEQAESSRFIEDCKSAIELAKLDKRKVECEIARRNIEAIIDVRKALSQGTDHVELIELKPLIKDGLINNLQVIK